MASAPEPAAMSSPSADRSALFFNLGRGAKGVALLLFLIPWVTVSCGGTEIASMSGLDLATGAFDVRNPMTGEVASPPPGGRSGDLWVIAAAGLIVASLALTFVLRRPLAALIAGAGSAVAAVLIGYTVLGRIPADVRADPVTGSASGGGSPADLSTNAQQMADMIRVEPATGFWLVMAALVAAAALNLMARGRAGP